MEPRNRNLFLAALAAIAVIGAVVVFLSTRGGNTSTPSAGNNSGPATRTATWTVNGQEQRIEGKKVNGNPAAGARFTLGEESAPVTIVEFANYQCHYCQLFAEQTKGQLISEFVDTGKAHFVYRDFPFANQANVVRASSAAACAADQDRYWDYHDVLYRTREAWAPYQGSDLDNRLVDYAGQMGLDTDALRSCLTSGKHDSAVNADAQAAMNLGLGGTPAFIIDGYAYEGAMPIEAFRKILEDAGAK